MWKDWNPSALLLGTQNGTATVENHMVVPQKVKNNYHMIQQFYLLSIYTPKNRNLHKKEKKESTVSKRYLYTHS